MAGRGASRRGAARASALSDLRLRTLAFGSTLGLHAAALALLLSYAPAREALTEAIVMIDFIAPPRVEPAPERRIEPPRPKPAARPILRPVDPGPVVASPINAAAPVIAPAPIEAPAPVPVAAPPEPVAIPVTPPVYEVNYLENPAPAYPPLSRRLGEQGRVLLRVLVSAEGTAAEVQVLATSGFARLDEAARETVRRWKFIPARRGAEPVAAWVRVPISFRLDG